MDPIAQLKEQEKVVWSTFSVLENVTGTASPRLLRFAGVRPGDEVLDVGCGTGVVALSAARSGARVVGVDLTPALLARAREHAALMKLEVTWQEGDVEALPFPDHSFDVVVSQFGHMFAPRPAIAVKEMLRVLKAGGTIAFATWPPELLIGQVFGTALKFAPPPPPGVSSPLEWGEPTTVRERLGEAVRDITFARGHISYQTLSVQHYRAFLESSLTPFQRLFGMLDATDAVKAAALRQHIEDVIAHSFEDNTVRQDYLLTRAVKL